MTERVFWEDAGIWITREQADGLHRGLVTGDWTALDEAREKAVSKPELKPEPEPEPGIRALIRPVITVRPASAHAKVVTVDWDELAELAAVADEAATPRDEDADSPRARGVYARGVRDALTWIAAGVPSEDLLNLLGRR